MLSWSRYLNVHRVSRYSIQKHESWREKQIYPMSIKCHKNCAYFLSFGSIGFFCATCKKKNSGLESRCLKLLLQCDAIRSEHFKKLTLFMNLQLMNHTFRRVLNKKWIWRFNIFIKFFLKFLKTYNRCVPVNSWDIHKWVHNA